MPSYSDLSRHRRLAYSRPQTKRLTGLNDEDIDEAKESGELAYFHIGDKEAFSAAAIDEFMVRRELLARRELFAQREQCRG